MDGKNHVSGKYTSAALGTLGFHIQSSTEHVASVMLREPTFLTRTFHESPPPIWIMTFPWNGSSMPRRPYNARQLETPCRRDSCGYMFGVHDDHSRVPRSIIMLHTRPRATLEWLLRFIFDLFIDPATRDPWHISLPSHVAVMHLCIGPWHILPLADNSTGRCSTFPSGLLSCCKLHDNDRLFDLVSYIHRQGSYRSTSVSVAAAGISTHVRCHPKIGTSQNTATGRV
ncbi:hypothetical protein EDC04DRAFT_1055811 [Pisolithus marmoratus]|nr:hypothetical protein EDC04DRAFT_1055811 [Pisolithus marmoratus]